MGLLRWLFGPRRRRNTVGIGDAAQRWPTPDERPVATRPVTDRLRFEIEYADADGVVTSRVIEPKSIKILKKSPWVLIVAHCHLRGDERTFYSRRIQAAVNFDTGRPIKDVGQYLRAKY